MSYNITNFPYVSTLQNYRATIIHLTELIIVFVANYYRTITVNISLPIKSHYHTPAIILYVCLVICTFISIISIIY
jgi:hypothetical protein